MVPYLNEEDKELFETAAGQARSNAEELCKMLGK
jgi:hypothetical protein